ncbi:MAG: hypothetical protein JWM91_3477 [Rhodospirillales bacterium]|nr:hypothetical protein [Rhodospirillales bacterium]
MTHLSPAMEVAWAAYQRDLEELRQSVYASDLATDAADQARAHYWFMQAQALAFNLVIAPRQSHPTFFVNTVFEPNFYTWILPNADFLYRYAFVDGARRFRISGRRGTSLFLEAQTISGFFGDPDLKLLKTYDFDKFHPNADGGFEIIVAPEAHADCPNWIATDPTSGNNTIIVREAFYDWTRETPSVLRIEPAVSPASTLAPLGDSDFIGRLGAASRLMKFCHKTFSGRLTEQVLATVGTNRFLLVDTSKDEHAANPSAGYVPCVYDLRPDEALIVEIDPPNARYWNLHLGDVWWQVTDFTHHQSSLNGHQVEFDSDGKARIVITAEDPGIANWLDPVGIMKGVAVLRWYFTDNYPTPAASVVNVRDLPAALPAETTWVTQEERRISLDERREAVMRRYGH